MLCEYKITHLSNNFCEFFRKLIFLCIEKMNIVLTKVPIAQPNGGREKHKERQSEKE